MDFPIVDFSSNGAKSQQGQVVSLEDLLESIDPPKEEDTDLDIGVDDDNPDTPPIVNPITEPDTEPDPDALEIGADDDKDKDPDVKNPLVQDYKSILKGLMDNKVIDQIEVFELEDGTEVGFDDMDITQEVLAGIITQVIEGKVQQKTEGKVSVDGVSDFTKKLIEIEKAGGNVQEALQTYEKYGAPLENLDMYDKDDQIAVLYMRYRGQNLKDDEISTIISGLEAKGMLEEKAVESKNMIQKALDDEMEAMKAKATERDKQYKEAVKRYRQELLEATSSIPINEAMRRKIVDSATKLNDGVYELDSAYYDIRNDPKQAAELAMFLLYKDEYIKRLTEDVKKTEAVNTFAKFRLTKKSSGTKILDDKDDNKDDGISLEQIHGKNFKLR